MIDSHITEEQFRNLFTEVLRDVLILVDDKMTLRKDILIQRIETFKMDVCKRCNQNIEMKENDNFYQQPDNRGTTGERSRTQDDSAREKGSQNIDSSIPGQGKATHVGLGSRMGKNG